MLFKNIQAVVTDIEGTTTSISFVHDVLFPYARERISDYVYAHEHDIGPILLAIDHEIGCGPDNLDGCIQALLSWMGEDRKITPLKLIQGLIWEEGYKNGAFQGHVYPDVAPNFKKWTKAGIGIYVYSSGSVSAQKLIFGYSDFGDLNQYVSGHFDTTTGNKKDSLSYTKIAQMINVQMDNILFLSDNPDELDAANRAGYRILGLHRPGNTFNLNGYNSVSSFDEINIDLI